MGEFCSSISNLIVSGNLIDSGCINNLSSSTDVSCTWREPSSYTYSNQLSSNWYYDAIDIDMGKILYMYISNGKTCISSDVPVYKEDLSTFYHAHGSKVIYIEGTGLMELMCTLLKVKYSKSGFIKLSSDSIIPMLMTSAKELSPSLDKEVVPFSMAEDSEASELVFDSEFGRRR